VEKSLIIIKPDGVKKRIIGEIISRFEREGLIIERLKMMRINRQLAEKHYNEHKEKIFFNKLIDYIISGPVVVMVISGDDVIGRVRELMGPTDSRQSAEREIKLFFNKEPADIGTGKV
jgi:nucleoside-diphosphate kinase